MTLYRQATNQLWHKLLFAKSKTGLFYKNYIWTPSIVRDERCDDSFLSKELREKSFLQQIILVALCLSELQKSIDLYILK